MANKIAIEIVVNDDGSLKVKQFSDNAKKALGDTESAAKGADSAFTGMVGTLKNMVGLAAAAFGVHEVVSFAKEATMLAARVETLGVVLGVVGENAGYSRGEMARYVDEVKKMGITTEVAHDAVIKIAQAQINAADSAKLARVAQDAAVIGNINSSDAFQRMINGIRSGEVEILKTIGLNVQFEQGYKRMAAELAKSTDSLTEQEKAQARANLVMEAGTRISGAYEASMGTAGKMMASLSRYTEELKLGFGQLFSGGLTDSVSGVTMLLKDMTAYMEQMRSSGAIAEISDLVATGLKMAWSSVKDVIDIVWNIIKPFGPMIAETLPILGLVAVGWGYIIAALKPVATVIGEIISSVFNLGKMGGSVFGMLGAALTGQFQLAGQYRDQFNAAYQSIAASGGKVVDAVVSGVEQSIMAHQRELNAAVTKSKARTAAELAAEEAISKARAESAKAENQRLLQQQENERAAADVAKKAAEARKRAEDSITEAIRKARIEADGIGKSQYEQDIIRIAAEAKKYEEAGASKILVAQYVAVQTTIAKEKALQDEVKAEQKRAETLSVLYRDLYTDLRGYETDYYAASVKLLDDQEKKYRAAGVSERAITAWKTEEMIKLDLRRLKSSNQFVNGVKAGYIEMTRSQETWGKTGLALFETFNKQATSQLSTNLVKVFKGKFGEIGADWNSLQDSMIQSFANSLSKMILEAATQEVVMFFKTTWTENGSNVLGIINKVLGFAGDLFGGSSTPTGGGGIESGYGFEDQFNAGGRVDYRGGGRVAGIAPYPGDHPGNDIVPAWLSPDEIVVRRGAVNPDTAEILDYINRFGRPPAYAFGGRVMNAVTDTPGRGYWGFGDLVSIVTGGLSDVFGVTNGGLGKDIFMPFLTSTDRLVEAIKQSNWADAVDAAFDPITGPGIDALTRGTGKYVNDVAPWFGDLMNIVAPIVGAVVGGVYGGPAGAAGGAAAGSGVASKFNQYSNEEALIKAGVAAAVAYVATPASNAINAGQITADMAGNAAYNAAIQQGATDAAAQAAYEAAFQETMQQALNQALLDAGLGTIKSFVRKWLVNEALGSVLDDPSRGQMSIDYMGASDNGLIGSLSSLMRQIAPQSSTFAFSAANGLDYVPRDNFRINAHEGEAVLTAPEAKEWREDKRGRRGDIIFEAHFHGTVIDRNAVNEFAELIYPQLKKLEAWGH